MRLQKKVDHNIEISVYDSIGKAVGYPVLGLLSSTVKQHVQDSVFGLMSINVRIFSNNRSVISKLKEYALTRKS